MELREKLSNFDHYNESHFRYYTQSLKVSPEAPFNWKLLIIGIVSAKGIRKNVPDLQVGGPAPASPTPPVFRVVLLHTEGAGKDTWPGIVSMDLPCTALKSPPSSSRQVVWPRRLPPSLMLKLLIPGPMTSCFKCVVSNCGQ